MRNVTHAMATTEVNIFDTSHAVDKIISPILYFFGFPGNIISIILWMQPRMRHSSGTYLTALGFTDLLFLVIHVLFELHKIWGVYTFDVPVLCEGLPVLFMATQYLSPLLVLGFTVERFICVRWPSQRDRLCTSSRAKIVSLCLAGFALLLASMQAYFYKFNKVNQTCEMRKSIQTGGHASLWSIWTWITEMLVFLCVPVLILVCNILIIRLVRRYTEFESSCKERALTTTFSLLLVSFYFIITTLPVSIVYAMRYTFVPLDGDAFTDHKALARYLLAKSIIEEIGMTHYACKFYLFLVAERPFREELMRLCMRIKVSALSSQNGYRFQTSDNTAHTDWIEVSQVEASKPEETNM
ncbi:uncharacterized protein LOC127879719 [Dreissena polymorpha]|nr:uncharacterized protein LOC127879719 [Dreissena polymorpha]